MSDPVIDAVFEMARQICGECWHDYAAHCTGRLGMHCGKDGCKCRKFVPEAKESPTAPKEKPRST